MLQLGGFLICAFILYQCKLSYDFYKTKESGAALLLSALLFVFYTQLMLASTGTWNGLKIK